MPPKAAFEELSADFFEAGGKTFLVIVDRLSNYFETVPMVSTAGTTTTSQFRMFFARWGSPRILRSDGGPQFISRAFAALMEQYRIHHVISSAYHAPSNGHAESAGVKQAKKLVAINGFGTPDYYRALAAQRNAVVRSRGESPAMMVLGRELNTGVWPACVRTRELPPAASRASQMMLEDVEVGGEGSTPVTFSVGDRVRVQDADPLGDHRWNRRGEIIKKHSQRSYVVLGDDGFQTRRNVRFIRLERDGEQGDDDDNVEEAPAPVPVPRRPVGRPRGAQTRVAPAGFVPRRSPRGGV